MIDTEPVQGSPRVMRLSDHRRRELHAELNCAERLARRATAELVKARLNCTISALWCVISASMSILVGVLVSRMTSVPIAAFSIGCFALTYRWQRDTRYWYERQRHWRMVADVAEAKLEE